MNQQKFILHPLSLILRMNRSYSLRRDQFQQCWDGGKSWSHPLVIVRACANGTPTSRFGFVAGKKIGKATVRNRAKRLMREAIRPRLPMLVSGWDIILIARSGATVATFQEIDQAIGSLLQRAKLIAE